jgi:IS5 family transposase
VPLSDGQTEYQLKDRWSFMRCVGLALHDTVADAKTIWLFREQLARPLRVAKIEQGQISTTPFESEKPAR